MMIKRLITTVILSLSLLLLSWGSLSFAQKPEHDAPSLDIILLMDSSVEVQGKDPDNLRVTAGRYLVDYLYVLSEIAGGTNRVGMANFGSRLSESIQTLQPITGANRNEIRQAIQPEVITGTDFVPALNFALDDFRTTQSTEAKTRAVILLTNGHPNLDVTWTDNLNGVVDDDGNELNLKKVVEQLKKEGILVFVISLNDTDRGNWQEIATEYRVITRAKELIPAYREIIAGLTNFEAGQKVNIPYYLDEVIFSFVKEFSTTNIVLTDHNGNPFKPVVNSEETVFYAIRNPEIGDGEITGFPGTAEMLVDYKPPRLYTQISQKPGLWGDTFNLEASIIRRDQPVVDNNLSFEAKIKFPNSSQVVTQALTTTRAGTYTLQLEELNQPGTYTVSLDAFYKSTPQPLQSVPLQFSVEATPGIGAIKIGHSPVISSVIYVSLSITDSLGLTSDPPITINILSRDGAQLETVTVGRADQSPDTMPEDGKFTKEIKLPSGTDTYILEITGPEIAAPKLQAVPPAPTSTPFPTAPPLPTAHRHRHIHSHTCPDACSNAGQWQCFLAG